jgi:hypothetical protein
MLALTAVLVVGQLVLLAAFAIGVVVFVGLIAYDLFSGSEKPPVRTDEQRTYAPAPAQAA